MSTTLRRRLYAGVLSTGLLAGVLIPFSGASAASCASWSDAKGDSTTAQSGQAALRDSQLDIVSAAFGTVGKDLVGTITTDGLDSSSSDAGDEFRFRFTIAEQDVILYVDRTAPLGEELDVTVGFYNFTARKGADATAEFDVKTKTVKLVGPLEELAKAVGKPVNGQTIKDLRAETLNQVLFGSRNPAKYDDAPTAATPVVGTVCTLGGAAAPGATGTPAPGGGSPASSTSPTPATSGSASPTAKPSASATGSAVPSPSPSPTPTGSPAPPQPTVPVPAAGCFGFADAKGDARPGGQAANDPDLDLLSVTGRTTPTVLAGHLRVDKLASKPSLAVFTGHRFEYQFTAGGKVIVLAANAEGPGEGHVDGAVSPDLKVTAAFDVVSSQVVLSVERAGLAKALGRTLPDGAVLEAQVARSIGRSARNVIVDTASTEEAARARYTVGDNTCFAPKISVSLPGQVQTSDNALVSVSMTTSDGRTAAGQTVTARVGNSRAVSARTDERGNATLVAPVTDAQGVRLLVVRSTGSAGTGELTSEMRVLTERAVLLLSARGTGAARTVTATLTDDDDRRRPLAGQRIVFKVGGRSVAMTTNADGRASTKAVKGSVVEATFAGRSGFLTPATTRIRS